MTRSLGFALSVPLFVACLLVYDYAFDMARADVDHVLLHSGAAHGGEGSSGTTHVDEVSRRQVPTDMITLDEYRLLHKPEAENIRFWTMGEERVWIDGDGTMHYRGSEVATQRDLNVFVWLGLLYGLVGGITTWALMDYLNRRRQVEWLESQRARLRVVDGPYR